MEKARIKIREKTIKVIKASNALKNDTAVLTQYLEVV